MLKSILLLAAFGGLLITGISVSNYQKTISEENRTDKHLPQPTTINQNMENEEEMNELRANYWEYIHSYGSPDIDWRAINQQNFDASVERRNLLLNSKAVESFANNYLQAEWIERGSNDQAGNVRVTAFDKVSETIYAIGDGGILFKSPLDGSNWEAVNDHYPLGRDELLAIRKADNSLRLLSTKGHAVYYSDDEGQTWTQASGFSGSATYGGGIDLYQLNDADSTVVYLYTYSDGWGTSQNRICYSKDQGETFTLLQTLSSNNKEWASMTWIEGFSVAYIIDQDETIYQFEDDHLNTIATNMNLGASSTSQLELSCDGVDTVLYALLDDKDLYRSNDAGYNFSFVSTLPTPTWDCGIGVSFDNPDAVYYGEVELYRSDDGGNNFTLVNSWDDYYNDVPNMVHADIMNIQTFKKSNGDEFTLIPNHGGINISYDELTTTPNIGLMELNVGQFYDVATSPLNSSFIFGGTQDQGLLRTGQGTTPGTVGFQQVISGDYGQQQFSNFGQSFWTQYPGGQFSYYEDAINAPWASFWESIDGNDIPNYGWIVPTCSAPNPEDDYILIGGGNMNGGSGSYLIKMENDGFSGSTFQYSQDFLALSGGMISAIETTPYEDYVWYLATENGKFFFSYDAGQNWTQTSSFNGPDNSWIFSSDIYASRLTNGVVYFGGRNYSGSPVYRSVDGGVTFTPINNGLPPTMVHEMCMDPDENFLFAATDAGPYVYSVEQDQWFDISGTDAPIQEYISCEYVAADNIVRFATWGRGIWDFKIHEDVSGTEEIENEDHFGIYPNPSNGQMNIYSPYYSKVEIYNIHGQEVLSTSLIAGNNNMNLTFLENGTYFLVGMDETGKILKDQFIIRK